MIKNIFKFVLAVCLLPAIFFALISAGKTIFTLAFASEIVIWFFAGTLLYIAIHFTVYNFSVAYVIAHELMHAISALFFGYKVHSIKVKKNSGHVKLSEYNTAVVLAPYIIPFYFIIGAITCFIFFKNGYNTKFDQNLYACVLGVLWSFHIVHTLKTLTETSQPDLKIAGGVTFSVVIIMVLNLFFVLLLLAILFPNAIMLWPVLKEILLSTLNFWQKLLNYIWNTILHVFKL